jgi:hypothetical protein
MKSTHTELYGRASEIACFGRPAVFKLPDIAGKQLTSATGSSSANLG